MRRFDKKKNIAKANLISEQRYLESKGLIKEGSQMGLPIQKEQEVSEIGPETAAGALGDLSGKNDDPRSKRILQDAIKSMFKKYYQNPEAKFGIQLDENMSPMKMTLTQVGYYKEPDASVGFTFESDVADEDAGKSTWGLTYDVRSDEYEGNLDILTNQFTANFLVGAANAIRKMYFTKFPKKDSTGFDIKSKVKKQDFRFF